MGRKQPLNLDIDEEALLSQMFGGDFEELAKKKDRERKLAEEKMELSKVQEKAEILSYSKENNFPMIVSDLIEKLIVTNSQWDNSKRIMIDGNLSQELRRRMDLLRVIHPNNNKSFTVRNYINNILSEHIFETENIDEVLIDLLKINLQKNRLINKLK